MPDTKFSWCGLREHIRKYLWVYLAGIALCLVGTSLLWTTTEPRPDNDEVVAVYMADTYSNPEPLNAVAADALERTRPFDDTLKEVRFESMLYSEGDYTSNMLMLTRLTVGECDAFLASQAAMDALVTSGALTPLDEAVAAGWPGDYGLEPYTVTVEDEDTGEKTTYVAALRADPLDALVQMGAFENRGAYLCVAANGGNVETTMKALEFIVEDLMEAEHAGTEAAQQTAR